MTFDLGEWKKRAGESLRGLGGFLSRTAAKTPYTVYAGLCTLNLFPLVEASRAGELLPMMLALGGVAGSVGGNLIANQIQAWKDKSDEEAQADMSAWIASEAPHNEQLRAALDDIAAELDALHIAQSSLGKRQVSALRKELQTLGNLPRYEAVLTGSNNLSVQGENATVATRRAVIVKGKNTGGINTGTQTIINYYLRSSGKKPDRKWLSGCLDEYLNWLRSDTAHICLQGIERIGESKVVQLPIDTVFVPLRHEMTSRMIGREMRDGAEGKAHRGKQGDIVAIADGAPDNRDIALPELLPLSSRMVIMGGPGSGKTTVLTYIAWALASSLLDGSDLAHRKLGLEGDLPLPIFVPLASFHEYLRKCRTPRKRTLAAFIPQYLEESQALFNLPGDFFPQLLKSGQHLLLLLDGLDEVTGKDEVTSRDNRAIVRESIQKLVTARPQLRVVVTCRTVAYKESAALGGFQEVSVKPLDYDEHITPMVREAYRFVFDKRQAEAKAQADDLLGQIVRLEQDRAQRAVGDDARLVSSPLMVRLLLIVHYNEHRLPDQRADLFDKAINALVQVDYSRVENVRISLTRDWKRYRDMAQTLAFHMHTQGEAQGRVVRLQKLREFLNRESEHKPYLEGFITQASTRGGLLEERNGEFRFIHLALQEFLVASYLRLNTGAAGVDKVIAFLADGHLTDAWWREPTLLLVGYWSSASLPAGRELLQQLAGSGNTADERFRATELAGVAALEWQDCPSDERAAIAQGIADMFADRELGIASSPVIRARAGRVLSQLGDRRRGVGLLPDGLPDIDWVTIPDDGEFIYGEGETKRKMRLPAFKISRYPITYAQYQAFIDANDGYRDERWWEGMAVDEQHRQEPWYQRFKYANHPSENVSWYDALAFCHWLRFKLGEEFRLPDEREWEKAARGHDGREFPWGDGYVNGNANIDEIWNLAGSNYMGMTSPVGMYPQGQSPYGVNDMSGNVWEWCTNAVDDLTNVETETEDHRILRGGSWLNLHDKVRTVSRLWDRPISRSSNVGFRLVVLLPPNQSSCIL